MHGHQSNYNCLTGAKQRKISGFLTIYIGHLGDEKIFVYNVHKVVKVRTGEEDFEALKDVE